ncbi:rho GTPase-activating protein 36 isoform X2 [Nelusetta ayraudi]|uniref:rho GTPase-activating protein 36 isoform X2 n=1 Tax=Nelusetta ayraudi TaxID=303726 RepID=UPI003F6ED0CD
MSASVLIRRHSGLNKQGDDTWATMLGQSVRLQPVPIQILSELERARLQEVALYHLDERDLDFKISIPKETHKRRKSLRRRFDSFSKEKKERESAPKAFGIPLSEVIANDRAFKRRQDALKESRRDCLDLEASVLRFRAEKRQFFNGSKPLVSSVSIPGGGLGSPSANSVAPAPDAPSRPLSPRPVDSTGRQRRGGLSVDSISDLVESQSRLLEALQLSHPAELELKKTGTEGRTQNKLSLNPIYRQVPRVVERCCCHIETHGLQTVGIFRVGSSKKRVRQLRDDFDMGADVQLDEEHSVHDVAALLKEFLRDMPDPLLPRELYPAFLHANLLRGAEQLQYLQHLLYLLPPCNCDTLLRLLSLLHTVHSYAQDSIGTNDEEIPGNKMTAANLAVIFGPNLLQKERGADANHHIYAMGIEDSTAIINVTLVLIQNYRRLFTVSAELQQEVLMSLIQTDPDIIDYLLRRKLSGSHLTLDGSGEPGGRRDTGASLDSVGASSGSLSPLEPPSPLFPPDGSGGEGSLTSEVFLNVLKLNQNRKRQETKYGDVPPGKSIRHMRQFHSHHNLLSLAQPSLASRLQGPETDSPERRATLCSTLGFTLGGGGGGGSSGSSSSLSGSTESSIWVRQTPQEEGKQSPAANFWDFFTGKGSSSETMV